VVEKAKGEARLHGKPYEVEIRLRRFDGVYRGFVSRGVPLYDDHGQPVQWFGTNTDVEERREAAETLRRAQAELAHVTRLTTIGELTASLAHELNQPLAAVATNASACLTWLGRTPPNIEEARSAIVRISRDTNRVSDVIAHTRSLFRKSNGEKTPVDVTEVIRETLILVPPEILTHRIIVRESLAEDLPKVLGDRIQLQQVVLNLITNGIEAMADVGERRPDLAIRSQRHEVDGRPGVLVAVRDAGVGVAPENLGRLFEAFYTTKPQGLGLGLSISRSIIHAHGGVLWASRNPDHGATFHFFLPAASAP
jgi:C4-dicarboxylate-specific signal transduction histidine kinase